jgi:hypothetical protein
MSLIGTFETFQDVRSLVAIGGKADNICSMRVLRILTQLCHSMVGLAVLHHAAVW